MSENQVITFFDTIGRTILGKQVDSNEQTITVENPAVVQITPNQSNGQLTLQILPIFFREFLADPNAAIQVIYNRSTINEIKNLTLSFRVKAQYEQNFLPQGAAPAQPVAPKADVIKLFED
jgi:hypothetical protein